MSTTSINSLKFKLELTMVHPSYSPLLGEDVLRVEE